MKIAFVGNQDNNAYCLCKWFRSRGQEADLYMIRQERGPRSLPELVDPQIAPEKQGYPDWVRPYDDQGPAWFLHRSRLAEQLAGQYDVLITSGATGLLAVNHFRNAPIIHLTLGSEVSDHVLRLFSLRASLPWRGVALLMRRALKKVRRIITLGFEPEMAALAKLGHLDKVFLWAFPADAVGNLQRVDRTLLRELNERYASADRVFVWLSRLNYRQPELIRYKAPEVFLQAFERLAMSDRRNVRAVIGTHGEDLDDFQRMVRDKGLADRVDYVPHLPLWQAVTYSSIANAALVDVPNLARGYVPGGIAREAMSVGAVVVRGFNERMVEFCYGPNCPMLQARDVDSCYAQIKRLTDMSAPDFAALKTTFHQWAMENLHYEKPLDRLQRLMEEVAYAQRFRQ